MKLRGLKLVVVFILLLINVSATGTAAAPEGILGVTWGASPQDVKQVMDKTGFTLWKEDTDPQVGYYATYADGLYAGYSVTGLTFSFLSNQAYAAKVSISDKRADIQAAYADLKKLLTQKYGLPKPEVVLHIPVNMPGVRTTVMDTYVTEWSLDNGSELPFTIALNKNPTWGTVEVYYANKALREKLKTQSRQDI
jgi:hypothetical protein